MDVPLDTTPTRELKKTQPTPSDLARDLQNTLEKSSKGKTGWKEKKEKKEKKDDATADTLRRAATE
jgi:hypothetical protein